MGQAHLLENHGICTDNIQWFGDLWTCDDWGIDSVNNKGKGK